MNGEEVRNMTDEELNVEEQRLRRRLFDLRAQAVTEKLDDPTQLHKTKHDIARICTERRARTLANPA